MNFFEGKKFFSKPFPGDKASGYCEFGAQAGEYCEMCLQRAVKKRAAGFGCGGNPYPHGRTLRQNITRNRVDADSEKTGCDSVVAFSFEL
jgi:hypothetical protein